MMDGPHNLIFSKTPTIVALIEEYIQNNHQFSYIEPIFSHRVKEFKISEQCDFKEAFSILDERNRQILLGRFYEFASSYFITSTLNRCLVKEFFLYMNSEYHLKIDVQDSDTTRFKIDIKNWFRDDKVGFFKYCTGLSLVNPLYRNILDELWEQDKYEYIVHYVSNQESASGLFSRNIFRENFLKDNHLPIYLQRHILGSKRFRSDFLRSISYDNYVLLNLIDPDIPIRREGVFVEFNLILQISKNESMYIVETDQVSFNRYSSRISLVLKEIFPTNKTPNISSPIEPNNSFIILKFFIDFLNTLKNKDFQNLPFSETEFRTIIDSIAIQPPEAIKSLSEWQKQYNIYRECVVAVNNILLDRSKWIYDNYIPDLMIEYKRIESVYIASTGGTPLPVTSQALDIEHQNNLKEHLKFTKVVKWLSEHFNSSFNYPTMNPINGPVKHILNNIKSFLRVSGTITNFDTVNIINHFVNNGSYFKSFYDSQKGTTLSLDMICQEFIKIIDQLINHKDDIFQVTEYMLRMATVSADTNIEFKAIFDYLKPNNNNNMQDRQELLELFEMISFSSKFADSYKSAENFFSLVSSNYSTFISLDQEMVDIIFSKIDSILKKKTTKTELKKDFRVLSNLLGGLKTDHIDFFKIQLKDLFDFFATSYDNYDSFVEQTAFISSDNSTNDFNTVVILDVTNFFATFKELIENKKNIEISNGAVPKIPFQDLCQKHISKIEKPKEGEFSLEVLKNLTQLMDSIEYLFSTSSQSKTLLIVKMFKKSGSCKFESKVMDSLETWLVSQNGSEIPRESLDKLFQDIKEDNVDEKIKGKYAEELEDFIKIFELLEAIHIQHYELVRVHHPDYTTGSLSIDLKDEKINQLNNKFNQFKAEENFWILQNNSLKDHTELKFLRYSGISSLYRQLKTVRDSNMSKATLVSNLQFAYSHKDFDTRSIQTIVNDVVRETNTTFPKSNIQDITTLLKVISTKIEAIPTKIEPISPKIQVVRPTEIDKSKVSLGEERKKIEFLDLKEHSLTLHGVLYSLNGNKMPHPNQIFYSDTFHSDIDCFKHLVEAPEYTNLKFFIIISKRLSEKDCAWIAKESKNSTFSKIYVLSDPDQCCDSSSSLATTFSFLDKKKEIPSMPANESIEQIKKIKELNLVSGPFRSGKTHYIKSMITNKPSFTFFIRPNFELRSLLKTIRNIKNEKELYLHIDISYFSTSFLEFSRFIYPLILYGFVYDYQKGDIVFLPESIDLTIYIEISNGEEGKEQKESFERSLVKALAKVKTYDSKADWIPNDNENYCLSYMQCDFIYQPKKTTFGQGMNEDYRVHLDKLLKSRECVDILDNLNIDTRFILETDKLPYRKSFFNLLAEKLRFLEVYYDYMMEIGWKDRSNGTKNMDQMPTYKEVYCLFVIECLFLSRTESQDMEFFSSSIPFISFFSSSIENYSVKSCSLKFINFRKVKLLSKDNFKNYSIDPSEDTVLFKKELSNAFGLHSEQFLSLINMYGFVFTPEIALRLLVIKNKLHVNKSLVLTGDTGVGKTFLLMFYSLLINAKFNFIPDILGQIRDSINNFAKECPTYKYTDDSSSLRSECSLEEILSFMEHMYANIEADKRNRLNGQISDRIQRMVMDNRLIKIDRHGEISKLFIKADSPQNVSEILGKRVKEICTSTTKQFFHRIPVHEKYTPQSFYNDLTNIIRQSNELRNIKPELRMIVFIDELNTSPKDTLALITELFTNNTVDGQSCIPTNILWIGAMNPKTLIQRGDDEDNIIEQLAFIVKNVSPSFESLYLNFGVFNSQLETEYINELFKKSELESYSGLKKVIQIGQRNLREIKQIRTHVSIRDIARGIDLYLFFTNDPNGKIIIEHIIRESKRKYNPEEIKLLIVAWVNYVYRIQPSKREKIIDDFKGIFNSFEEIVDIYKTLFIKITLPLGIAKTDVLYQNMFMNLLAILNNLPLAIISKPGWSKTLSFNLIHNILNNTREEPFDKFPIISPLRFQCNSKTTDIQIKSIYEGAQKTKNMKKNNNRDFRCTIFLDEASLIDEKLSPMKILHDYLEKGISNNQITMLSIPIIILSNKMLDAAKTNRVLLLLHDDGQPTEDDLIELAKGCLFQKDVLNLDEIKLSKALAESYLDICNDPSINGETPDEEEEEEEQRSNTQKRAFYHQRDFVFLLRYLGARFGSAGLIKKDLVEGLERNFNGVDQTSFKKIVDKFITRVYPDQNYIYTRRNPINCVIDSLLNSGSTIFQDQLINTLAFRFTMIIDPSSSEASIMILNEVIKTELEKKRKLDQEVDKDKYDLVTIRVGDFKKDQTERSIYELVSQICNCMEKGKTMLLVNSQPIDAYFYDLFNRYFIVPKTIKGESRFLVQVSFGTHSMFCPVNPNFKLILHVPLAEIPQTQLPLLNRFEKYRISMNDLLLYYFENHYGINENQTYYPLPLPLPNPSSKQEIFEGFKQLIKEKISNNSPDQVGKETITSLVYYILKKDNVCFSNDGLSIDFERIEEKISTTLTKILNTEDLYSLDQERWIEHDNYLKFIYIFLKEDFFINIFLETIFDITKKKEAIKKWIISTKTSHHLIQLKNSQEVVPDRWKDFLDLFKFPREKVDVLSLSTFHSGFKFSQRIKLFFERPTKEMCIVIADMDETKDSQIRFIQEEFDEQKKRKPGKEDAVLVIICHKEKPSNKNSFFINETGHVYINSISSVGLKKEEEKNRDKNHSQLLSTRLSEIFEKCIKKSFSNETDYSNVLNFLNQKDNGFNTNGWFDILIQQFINFTQKHKIISFFCDAIDGSSKEITSSDMDIIFGKFYDSFEPVARSIVDFIRLSFKTFDGSPTQQQTELFLALIDSVLRTCPKHIPDYYFGPRETKLFGFDYIYYQILNNCFTRSSKIVEFIFSNENTTNYFEDDYFTNILQENDQLALWFKNRLYDLPQCDRPFILNYETLSHAIERMFSLKQSLIQIRVQNTLTNLFSQFKKEETLIVINEFTPEYSIILEILPNNVKDLNFYEYLNQCIEKGIITDTVMFNKQTNTPNSWSLSLSPTYNDQTRILNNDTPIASFSPITLIQGVLGLDIWISSQQTPLEDISRWSLQKCIETIKFCSSRDLFNNQYNCQTSQYKEISTMRITNDQFRWAIRYLCQTMLNVQQGDLNDLQDKTISEYDQKTIIANDENTTFKNIIRNYKISQLSNLYPFLVQSYQNNMYLNVPLPKYIVQSRIINFDNLRDKLLALDNLPNYYLGDNTTANTGDGIILCAEKEIRIDDFMTYIKSACHSSFTQFLLKSHNGDFESKAISDVLREFVFNKEKITSYFGPMVDEKRWDNIFDTLLQELTEKEHLFYMAFVQAIHGIQIAKVEVLGTIPDLNNYNCVVANEETEHPSKPIIPNNIATINTSFQDNDIILANEDQEIQQQDSPRLGCIQPSSSPYQEVGTMPTFDSTF